MDKALWTPFLLLLVPSLLASSSSTLQEEAPITLAEALQRAAEQSEEIARARVRERRASAERRQALASVLPALTVTGTYTRRSREVSREVGGETITVQARDAYAAQGVLESTLVDFRALPVLEAADRLVQAAALEAESALRTVGFEVARSYLAVLAVEQLAAAANQRLQVAEQTVRETRFRRQAGLATRNDETRSELELATSRLQKTDLERQVALARLELGFWLGQEVSQALVPPEIPPPASRDFSELVRQAHAARADLHALRERLEAAKFTLEAAARSWVPTLDFRGLYRWTNEAGLSGRRADWNLGLVLSWSLWDGGAREALVEVRKSQAQEIELELQQLERRVSREIRQALEVESSARVALEQAEVQARVAQENAEEVRARYREGLATALEQADAQAAVFEAAAELARARFQLQSAQLDLLFALGEPDPLGRSEAIRSAARLEIP